MAFALLDQGPELQDSDAADKNVQVKQNCVIGRIQGKKELDPGG